eukprot:CAMPEP_0168166684 /NCGR_PEP_ID=MMETSP0139_2-20121125/2159_1 /TAXON_ID=44445 /ORGANISM="Pseudo-nitzschia australis, Strain 10249 10 AB" /LENGTH=409 /DNA_ID=CAMNT_0008083899 /DNA_START=255 /DNA_END=1481 /DNA_ORIENTATION=+
MIRAEIDFEGSEWCLDHGNDLGSSSSSDLSCYGGNFDESPGPIPAWKAANSDESASLIPIWKDDDDSSSSYDDSSARDNRFGGIPSTLEFAVLLDGEVARGEDVLPPPVSPSTLSSQSQMIGGEFPSLPFLETMDAPPNKDDFGISEVAADMVSSAERLNSFRRRLHSSMDIGNGSLSESQSSSRPLSPPLSLLSSPPPRYNIVRRASPRFVLMLGAIMLVFLSVHDTIQNSRRYYREQYRLLSSDANNRREEIAFPIVQVQVHSDDAKRTTRTTYQHRTDGHEHEHEHNQNEYHAELPKFDLSKFETPRNINSIRGGSASMGGRVHNNLAMARSKEHPRPIFVPDMPLPNGGFRKPLERFVFDDSGVLNQHQQSGRRFADQEYSSSSSSWTSWMVSLVLIAMLFDTGW